jgi:hypothetical protein
MGNTIIRSFMVVACISAGAFAVFTGLQTVFADEGPEQTGPTRTDRLERIFSEPGIAPGETVGNAEDASLADPYRNPVGVAPTGARDSALRAVSAGEHPPATAIRRWWPAEPAPSGFGIRHVGPLAGEQAIAIVFHGAVRPEALAEHVTVRDSDGRTLDAQWQVPEDNSRIATLPVPDSGRYTLIVDGRLADVRGRALGANMHGPVFVQ